MSSRRQLDRRVHSRLLLRLLGVALLRQTHRRLLLRFLLVPMFLHVGHLVGKFAIGSTTRVESYAFARPDEAIDHRGAAPFSPFSCDSETGSPTTGSGRCC